MSAAHENRDRSFDEDSEVAAPDPILIVEVEPCIINLNVFGV